MTLTRTLALCAATFAFAAPAFALAPSDAPSGTYKVDPTHASVVWKVKHMGLAWYSARFVKFDAEIKYDAATPAKSQLSVTIDPKSVRTEYPFPEKENFDEKLANDEKLLNSGKFPDIKFVSKKLTKTGATTGKLLGDLTLLGVTKPMTLDVTLTGAMKQHPFTKNAALGFSATGTLKRSDFGMTSMMQFLSDDVQLDINGEFQKAE
jgi:polyisoprenoid-binding protein YceI